MANEQAGAELPATVPPVGDLQAPIDYLWFHLQNGVVFGIAPLVFIAVVACIVIFVLPIANSHMLPSVAFATAGVLVGTFVGASRSSIIAVAFPVIFTLITTYFGWLIFKKDLSKGSKDAEPVDAAAVATCLVALVFGLSFGGSFGSSMRETVARDEIRVELQKAWADLQIQKNKYHYENLEIPLKRKQLEAEFDREAASGPSE